jgi:hypothetical protein
VFIRFTDRNPGKHKNLLREGQAKPGVISKPGMEDLLLYIVGDSIAVVLSQDQDVIS